MKAHEFLKEAGQALEQRAALRDQPTGERSAPRAAAILTAWTGREHTEMDVWRTLLAIKLAREIQGQYHADDYTDLAGYAGLLGECAAGLARDEPKARATDFFAIAPKVDPSKTEAPTNLLPLTEADQAKVDRNAQAWLEVAQNNERRAQREAEDMRNLLRECYEMRAVWPTDLRKRVGGFLGAPAVEHYPERGDEPGPVVFAPCALGADK